MRWGRRWHLSNPTSPLRDLPLYISPLSSPANRASLSQPDGSAGLQASVWLLHHFPPVFPPLSSSCIQTCGCQWIRIPFPQGKPRAEDTGDEAQAALGIPEEPTFNLLCSLLISIVIKLIASAERGGDGLPVPPAGSKDLLGDFQSTERAGAEAAQVPAQAAPTWGRQDPSRPFLRAAPCTTKEAEVERS